MINTKGVSQSCYITLCNIVLMMEFFGTWMNLMMVPHIGNTGGWPAGITTASVVMFVSLCGLYSNQ